MRGKKAEREKRIREEKKGRGEEMCCRNVSRAVGKRNRQGGSEE